MTVREIIEEAGYEDVIIFENFSYDDAFIGVSHDNRAVYDYEQMVMWLMEKEGWSEEDAVEWIEFNTIRSLPYLGDSSPIVVYPILI